MTDRYAVIGNPVSHSKSPFIHRQFAQGTGQDLSYDAIEAPLDGFAATIERLREEGYSGCNVTVPFKFDAYRLATELTGRAKAARAVNTLSFKGDTILGDNTDGAGLLSDLKNNLHVILQGARVLLMGAGGASYGVVLPLLTAGATLVIANRTASRAVELAGQFDNVTGGSYEQLAELSFDVVINATSAGLDNSEILLPAGIFAPGSVAYDMMYGRETPFMRYAKIQGAATVVDGLGMLVEQAAEAFYVWRGIRPGTASAITLLSASR
jgi:shikimate dehydrogenase